MGKQRKRLKRYFHRTTRKAVNAILASGFRDRTGKYLTDRQWRGVWLSDIPLDIDQGARGGVLLQVQLPPDLVEQYEWKEEGKPYREFLVPANLINRRGVGLREVDEASLRRNRRSYGT